MDNYRLRFDVKSWRIREDSPVCSDTGSVFSGVAHLKDSRSEIDYCDYIYSANLIC